MVAALALAFVIAAEPLPTEPAAAEPPAAAAAAATEPAPVAATATIPPEPVAPEPAPAPPPSNPGLKRAGLIIGLSGGVISVAGIVMRLLAGSAYDRIDIGYPAFKTYAELQSVRRTGELEQNLAFGLLAGGVALILVGALLSFIVGGP